MLQHTLHLEDNCAAEAPRAKNSLSREKLLEEARSAFRSQGFVSLRATIATRCIEVVVALAAIVTLSPVFLVLALLIRRGSPGPVLFSQMRIREGLRPFTLHKFRTLYSDSRERFPELFDFARDRTQIKDFKFKLDNDPRVTSEGHWLRASSLDELPNFWNLLKGEVALVGPRPEIPEMLPNYETFMLKKFSVRPGITGLAQVSGRSDLTFLEGIEYDLRYVESRSLMLDLKILWLTVAKCLSREGAR